MKIIPLFILISAMVSNAQTWTIHGFKDNFLYVIAEGPTTEYPGNLFAQDWFEHVQWDWTFDQSYPVNADSGVDLFTYNGAGAYNETGYTGNYSDVQVISVPSGLSSPITNVRFILTGPSPDYGGTWDEFTLAMVGGEFWIDFASDGSDRVSATQPSDWGKWAWDGSVNPTWSVAKKGLAKGHNKQPLPTTK